MGPKPVINFDTTIIYPETKIVYLKDYADTWSPDGESELEGIPLIELEDYNIPKVIVASSCITEGVTITLLESGELSILRTPYGDHNWNDFYTVDDEPRCDREGSESIHCSLCGTVKEGTVRPAEKVEHSFSDWWIVRQPTCTEDGLRRRTCTSCWTGEVEAIPATGHTLVYVESVPATYENSGNIEYYKCETCGKLFDDEECTNRITYNDTVIPSLFSIEAHPSDVSAYVGETVELHVETLGSGLTYRWQWSSDGETWKNCTSGSYNTDTLNFLMKESLAGRMYRCRVTKGKESIYSNEALISLKTINIIKNPENVVAYAGEQVVLLVETEGDGLSYQWQWSSDGTTWKNCTSGDYNKAEFSFTMKASLAGRKYRCVITAANKYTNFQRCNDQSATDGRNYRTAC